MNTKELLQSFYDTLQHENNEIIKNYDDGDDNKGKFYWDKGASLKVVLIFRPRLPLTKHHVLKGLLLWGETV